MLIFVSLIACITPTSLTTSPTNFPHVPPRAFFLGIPLTLKATNVITLLPTKSSSLRMSFLMNLYSLTYLPHPRKNLSSLQHQIALSTSSSLFQQAPHFTRHLPKPPVLPLFLDQPQIFLPNLYSPPHYPSKALLFP